MSAEFGDETNGQEETACIALHCRLGDKSSCIPWLRSSAKGAYLPAGVIGNSSKNTEAGSDSLCATLPNSFPTTDSLDSSANTIGVSVRPVDSTGSTETATLCATAALEPAVNDSGGVTSR